MSDAEQRNRIVKVLKSYPGITANMDLSTNSALVVDLVKATQPTPVDGELRENILFGLTGDSYGEALSIPGTGKDVADDLEKLFTATSQAAVHEAERKTTIAVEERTASELAAALSSNQAEINDAVAAARTRYMGIGEYIAVSKLLMKVGYLLEHRRQGGMLPMTSEVVKELYEDMKKIQEENDKYMRPQQLTLKEQE